MQRIFNWTQKHRDVSLEFDGGYMGNPSTMAITMRYKPQPRRIRQIITAVSIDALCEHEDNVYELFDDMYKVLVSDIDDTGHARKGSQR